MQELKMATFKEVSLSSKLYDEIALKIRNSYPNACIIRMQFN